VTQRVPLHFFRWENGVLKHSEEPVRPKTGGFVELVESTPSADGRRMFFDFNDGEIHKFQHVLDSIRMVAALRNGCSRGCQREHGAIIIQFIVDNQPLYG